MFIFTLLRRSFRFLSWSLRCLRDWMLFAFLLLFFMMLFYGFQLLQQLDENYQTVEQTGILRLNIKGAVMDRPTTDPSLYALLSALDDKNDDARYQQNSLFEITDKIEQASSDPEIKAILIELDQLTTIDFPSITAINNALMHFKAQDKKIYAIGSYYDVKRYSIASLADEISLLHHGNIELYGLSVQNFYFKSLLNKLNIEPQIFKVGTYKSAVEPFLRDSMSNDARKNTTLWLTQMWHNILGDMAHHRQIEADNLVPHPYDFIHRLEQAQGNVAQYALTQKIVDHITSYDYFIHLLNHQYPGEPLLSFYDYELQPKQPIDANDDSVIHVVFVEGAIKDGQSDQNDTGSLTVIQQLQEAIEEQSRGILLRINSPGGGVFASESIRQKLKEVRQHGIPVVVSMGGMAASGGYWIATESDYIMADRNTLTGSIGIFGIVPNIEGTIHALGIYQDGVSTSVLASESITKPLSMEMQHIIQQQIQYGYQHFLSIVSTSRHLSLEETEQVAEGQVWLGEEALKLKLVDSLGTFDDALLKLAELADLEHYSIHMPNESRSFLDRLLSGSNAQMSGELAQLFSVAQPMIAEINKPLSLFSILNDPQNSYALCLNCPQ